MTSAHPPRAHVSVVVNGTPAELRPGTTLAQVVGDWCATTDGVAAAIGRDVIPRSEWTTTRLSEGDEVEIVTAAAGG